MSEILGEGLEFDLGRGRVVMVPSEAYPVASVNGKVGNVELNTSDIPNDSSYITDDTAKLAGFGTLTDDHVRALLNVAETWFNQAYTKDGEFSKIWYDAGKGPYYMNAVKVKDYGNEVFGPDGSDVSYMVCSEFSEALLNGITFERSRSNMARYLGEDGEIMRGLPYYLKRSEPNIMLPWAYQWDATYPEYGNSANAPSGTETDAERNIKASLDNRFLLAAEQAHYAHDHGFGFAIGDQPLRPGDFVFNPYVADNYMNIGHVAFVVQVSDDQSKVLVAQSGGAEVGGGMKKDGEHAGVNLSVFPVSHYTYAARFPLGAVPKTEPVAVFVDKTEKTTGDSVEYTYYTRDASGSSWVKTPHAVTESRAASYAVTLQKGFYTILLDTDVDGLYCVASHGSNIKRRYPAFFTNGERKIMTVYIEEETDALWIMGTIGQEQKISGITIVKGYASAQYHASIAGIATGSFTGSFSGIFNGSFLGAVSRRPNSVVTLDSDTVTPLDDLHSAMQNFTEYTATVDGYTNTETVSDWQNMPGRAVWFLSGRKNYAGQGVQRITTYVTALCNREWIRSCINGTWTAWVEIGGGS